LTSKSRFVAAIKRASVRRVARAAQTLEFAFLQDAQKLGLKLQGDFSNLIEEDRSAMGRSKRPLAG